VTRSFRILVVDDDTDVAGSTARLLQQAGYSVDTAATGADVWTVAGERAPDLLLLDRDLPDIDGLELCRGIKRAPALAGALVVLISSSCVDSESQAEGLEAGADGYIAGPITNRELLARVGAFERLLSMSRSLQAQSDLLRATTESTLQSQLATLNLLEDAREAQQRAEQAQTALAASEARARAIIEASPVPMALVDDQQRITFVNPALTHAFGYLREDFPTIEDWWPHAYPDPDYRQKVVKRWRVELARARESGSTFRPIEVQIQARDGSRRIALATVSAFSAGLDGSHLVTLLDITERKRMEKQVLQSEKLASIGLLAAGVAHEINNPIGYVNSNLGALKRLVGDLLAVIDAYDAVKLKHAAPQDVWFEVDAVKTRVELDYLRQELPSLLADSDEGLNRVKRIVKGLKDFAHTSAVDDWQPDDLIQGLESTLNVVWNELKYTCEVHKEYVELPLVDCVLSQINQVFMNLLVNAAQAIEGHGVITLRTHCTDKEVWVEVADTGRGMSAETLAHIFDPFYTTKEVGKGTGLGLSVSHGIIERHHGRIEVQSELGLGTTMRVCLPIRQPVPT